MKADLWLEGVPNWITGVGTVLTVLVAAAAACFAYKAAVYTKKQAEETEIQVSHALETLKIAQEDLRLAKETSDHQRVASERAYRLTVQAQLDVLAPTVVATVEPLGAGPEILPLWSRLYRDNHWSEWQRLTTQMEVPSDERRQFRFAAQFTFKNVSDEVALIDIENNARGQFENYSDSEAPSLVLPPHEEHSLTWFRYWSSDSLRMYREVYDPDEEHLNMRFAVRDQGRNIRDTFEFIENLRFFSKDGSRLIVDPQQRSPWTKATASAVPGRHYERWDRKDGTADPSSED